MSLQEQVDAMMQSQVSLQADLQAMQECFGAQLDGITRILHSMQQQQQVLSEQNHRSL